MPELPEVETITQDLRRRLVGWRITNVWSDWPKYFKLSGGLKQVRKNLKNRKIEDVRRRGKNILFYLSGGYLLAVHLKMTGHFLFDESARPGSVHLVLDLRFDLHRRSNLGGKGLYFSDVRKFARVLVGKQDWVESRPEIKKLGLDPLEIEVDDFLERLSARRGRIKTILLNQEILAGVGNIYSDEALYLAHIHPLSRVEKIPRAVLKLLFRKLVWVLRKSLSLKGSSRRDYRLPSGERGDYYNIRLVYDRKGEKCKCGGVIDAVKIGSRTSHFCPKCQIMY